ncbi:hypothetical protein RCH14_000957 [Massilia sp. MP_M2]|uniref:hypothetical protein n=1 Tax=Massilia sp. MP_M2 TaxID=3071713 RepID=UPI00319DFF03
MTFKDIPDQLLLGDDSAFTQWFSRGSEPFPGSDDHVPYLRDDTLTPAGTDLFLYRTKLGSKWIGYLEDLYYGRSIETKILAVLARLGLVDQLHQFTRAAFYKLVEASRFEQQVAMLDVQLTTSIADRCDGMTTEMHALSHLKRNGWSGLHDEGSAIHRLILMSWMNDVPLLKELLYRKPFMREGRYFMPGSLFMMGYADCVVDGEMAYSPASKAVLLDLVSRLTPARLETGYAIYCEEVESRGNGGPNTLAGIDQERKLLQYMDIGTLVKIADGMMSGTIPIDGWPDLTMFGPEGLALVEVKRGDKLKYHQARAIDRLASLSPLLFKSVSLHKIKIL